MISDSKALADVILTQLPDAKQVNEAKLLGIYFSLTDTSYKKNWSNTTAVIKSITDAHRSRTLTMFGKLNLIKSFATAYYSFVPYFCLPRKHTEAYNENPTQISLGTPQAGACEPNHPFQNTSAWRN